ncbi:hypothetical protein Ava_3898 [Trichormus variabilis ATCC 29413]|uniref:Uncharacterized protein n=1 Tax=Trichormus variabilis (strain ATCC 29413 / PCC 7937) TaxID=240292 RepID=Q3M683_TRIV2|nr:hypothetical protein Ava_3898 [Trichormus variabilis ATCC 29413]
MGQSIVASKLIIKTTWSQEIDIMTYISPKTLTCEDFLCQYRDNSRYELADGELIDMEPNGPHETVSGKLATHVWTATSFR